MIGIRGARAVALAVAAGSLLVGSALTAAASPAAAGEARYCAADLATRSTACAGTDTEAARLAGIGAQAVLAVRLYDGINYSGATYDFYVTAPCTPEYEGEYGNPNLGTFSNRASSVRTYNQCDVHLHDPVNYGSPYSVWIDASSNLSNIGTGWNNRASSIGVS
ncbi:hypothetical protein ACFV4N_19315 [Actinosynnema sp. NPDC059797]